MHLISASIASTRMIDHTRANLSLLRSVTTASGVPWSPSFLQSLDLDVCNFADQGACGGSGGSRCAGDGAVGAWGTGRGIVMIAVEDLATASRFEQVPVCHGCFVCVHHSRGFGL
jgi:hypothetical protein